MPSILQISVAILIVAVFVFIFVGSTKKAKWKKPKNDFPSKWRIILAKKVGFYNALNQEEKQLFEYKILEFLLNCKITGIQTKVDTTDKLLVAASAVIPVFAFPTWQYTNIKEVLIYPSNFNHNFETSGENRRILGMVGTVCASD